MSNNIENKVFSKREWINLIILLSIIQSFFWYIVFENSQSASALGYVSFAGTLVSIILAVLAIGYTYGESISQKNKSDGLAKQIITLGELISNFEIEAKSLNKIQDISKELSEFIGAYRNDKKSSDSQFDQIKKMVQSFVTPIKNTNDSVFVGPLNHIEKIMKDRTPLDETCYLIIKYIENNQTGEGIHGVDEKINDILPTPPLNLDSAFFAGAVYTQYSLLKNLDLIIENGLDFTIDPKLSEFIETEMISVNKESNNPYNIVIEELYKLIK